MRGQPPHPEGKYRSRSLRGVRRGNRWIVPTSILAHSKLGSR